MKITHVGQSALLSCCLEQQQQHDTPGCKDTLFCNPVICRGDQLHVYVQRFSKLPTPPFSFTYYCLSTLTLVLPYILARLLHLSSPRTHRDPMAQLTTESNISCFSGYCYFVFSHDGENTMRFELASQPLANQDLPRSYGVGMIVCMYFPLGREAVAAHSLTFRELCVCNGDWRGEEGRGCRHCEMDIARRTSCL